MKAVKSPLVILICLFGVFLAKYFFFDVRQQSEVPDEIVEIVQEETGKTGADSTSAVAGEVKEDSKVEPNYDFAAMFPPVEEMMKEKSFGNSKAPIVIEVYSSYSCNYCGDFFLEVFPKLLNDEITKDKVRVVFPVFPTNHFAVVLAMIERCSPNEDYVAVSTALYNNVGKLIGEDKEGFIKEIVALKDILKLDEEQVRACIAHEDLKAAIKDSLEKSVAKRKVRATPTLVYSKSIRSYTKTGSPSHASIKEIVAKMLNNEDPGK